MSNTTITPNMGLVVPTVALDPGPDWANNINADLGVLDQHNHSSGQGVQINPSGLNINSDLTLNGNNLLDVKSVQFVNLSSPLTGASPYLNCTYFSGGNLYANDGSGNQVKITSGGAVNATSSGISSGTATASFVGGVLVVDQNVNTPGNIQAGSILIGNNTAGSNFITFSAPNSLASNYGITLPPQNSSGATAVVTIDTSGNLGIGPAASSVNPPGVIVMYGGITVPSGWLLCDGSSYLISTYPNLAAALFDSTTGNYAYGSSGGTHFNVPQGQGMFMRGVDNGVGNDPDTASRTQISSGGNTGDHVGSAQGWQIQSHGHGFNASNAAGSFFNGIAASVSSSPPLANPPNAIQYTGGNQTNPINLYVNYIIKT